MNEFNSDIISQMISQVLPIIVTLSAFAVPLVTAIVEGLKKVTPEKHHKWNFIVSVVTGILLALLGKSFIIYIANIILRPVDTHLYNFAISFQFSILLGIIWGLSASGLYSGIKSFKL